VGAAAGNVRVKVAWLTHHLPGDRGRSGLLRGEFAGGAEMLDWDMVAAAPDGVEVEWVRPDEWQRVFDFQRVVVTGTDLLTEQAMLEVGELRPIVWVHHAQVPSPGRAYLFGMADPFVCMSDLHADHEAVWSGVRGQVCSGWIDVSGIAPGPKGDHALWAARDHAQKGRLAARFWAAQAGVRLVELSDVPRETVLEAMRSARYFVFLPGRLDACPRTLIEAEAAGCEIVTNGNAGRRPAGPLLEVMERQRERFWAWL